jgi:hypothetical protein
MALGALKPGGVVGLLGSSFGAIIGSRRECFPAIIVPSLRGRVLVRIMVVSSLLVKCDSVFAASSHYCIVQYSVQPRYDMLKVNDAELYE